MSIDSFCSMHDRFKLCSKIGKHIEIWKSKNQSDMNREESHLVTTSDWVYKDLPNVSLGMSGRLSVKTADDFEGTHLYKVHCLYTAYCRHRGVLYFSPSY